MYKDTLLVLSKLYKKQGKVKASVSLLKELVYGKHPPREAFGELEDIVLETQEKSSKEDITLVPLWNEVGQWLIDETREDFLFKVAKRLRFEGKPFIDLCSWLVSNASQQGRGKAAIYLADYYSGIGNMKVSLHYISIAKREMEPGDEILRVEAKILRAQGQRMAALKKIMMIKEIVKTDLDQMGSIIYGINKPESKDVQEAIAFYEKILNESDWDAEHYTMLADILYENNGRSKSLKYYRIAHNKNPDDKWAMYRVGRNAVMPESGDMFRRLEKEENLFGRLAKTKLMEIALVNKVKEVY
jgi:tetratricopeptide (TPR) repeat protein